MHYLFNALRWVCTSSSPASNVCLTHRQRPHWEDCHANPMNTRLEDAMSNATERQTRHHWGTEEIQFPGEDQDCFFFAFFLSLSFFFFFLLFRPHSRHMEVPRLEVECQLQLLAYTTATAMQGPNLICHLHRSSQQHWILNPLTEARDRTRVLMDTRWIHYHGATMGTLDRDCF